MGKITRVVCVANRKGGTGKSTVSILLAGALTKQRRRRVLILDCDEQQSVANTMAMEKEMYPEGEPIVEVRAISPVYVHDFLSTFGSEYDVVFLDVPRITEDKTNTALGQLLAMCDSVLIPVLGSQMDALSTRDFLRLVEGIAEYKKENGIPFQYAGFINRFTTRKDNEHAMDFMASIGLAMFDNPLNDLKIFTTPSVYFSIMDTAEGERRFRPFFDEFCKRFKIK